jgi:peptidoglycan hydrolase CwlO-like protein
MVFMRLTKSKMNKQQKTVLWQKLTSASTLVIAGILLLGASPLVHADSYQQQIDNLNAENSQTQATVSQLQVQATSYQDEINQLQTQIDDIQAGINANEAKQAELQQQITADEANIVLQKQFLSADIKAMYVGGQMTTIEELATSQNLSDFVDAQTYQPNFSQRLLKLKTLKRSKNPNKHRLLNC